MSFKDEKELQDFYEKEEELFYCPTDEDIWSGRIVSTNPSEPVVAENQKDNGKENWDSKVLYQGSFGCFDNYPTPIVPYGGEDTKKLR